MRSGIPPEIDPARRRAWLSNYTLSAWRFAQQAHQGQVRSADGSPYITHPETVADLVHAWGASTWAINIALLHDTLEDGPDVTDEVLRQHFGQVSLTALRALSKQKEMPKPHRRAEALARLGNALQFGLVPVETGLVKLADRAHNMVTSSHLSAADKKALTSDAHYWFAPLASALGMTQLAAWFSTWGCQNDMCSSEALRLLSSFGQQRWPQ